MKTASPPATSVLDQVTTWPGISPQKPPGTPLRSCSRVTSLATFTPTAAP
jgi:hypothetical protein